MSENVFRWAVVVLLAAGLLLAGFVVFVQGDDDVEPVPVFPEQGSNPGGRQPLDGAG